MGGYKKEQKTRTGQTHRKVPTDRRFEYLASSQSRGYRRVMKMPLCTRITVLLFVALCATVLVAEKDGMEDQGLRTREQADELERRGIPTNAELNNRLESIEKEMKALLSSGATVPWLRGRDGKDGKPGLNGPKGAPGAQGGTGARGPPGPRGSSGVQYVRWGKTSCSGSALLVYKGRVGGEWYDHPGGAAEYVCLPETPQYINFTPGHQHSGYMYGAEYEVHDRSPFTRGKALHEHDVPCAVCYVPSRSTQLMIPAVARCPAGWSREYYGYLMTSLAGHKHSSQFVCVDHDAEYVPGTSPNHNGALLFPVEGRCGTLPCAPYVEGYELTCVVCTK
ncbi:short-chain collagen C4-like isoform X2 [Nematostella vectensis]|uniref:short-chain collagen C4-like isoform X2 n=1 Tax=Nematostella vectensis TaxID=45351 RepID=UPI0020772CD3|nr:short-chain collagen C4-like isoform X2 [Nematostella vectensis]